MSQRVSVRSSAIVLCLLFLTQCGIFAEIPDFEETFCLENQRVESNRCVACSAGSTNEEGDGTDGENTTCDPIICDANERVRANQCVSCAVGEVNPAGDRASGADTVCSPILCGENQRVSQNACTACPVGELNAAGDKASGPDTSCDGMRCLKNQRVESNMCVSCPAGSTNDAGDDATGANTQCESLFCEEGQYVQANQCKPCAPGTRNAQGDDASGVDTMCDVILCEKDQRVRANTCVPCPAGTARQAGDDASGEDTQCSGLLCEANQRVQSKSCVPCGAGEINEPGDDASGADTFCQPLKYTQVSAGAAHTCAVTATGGVRCWGDNSFGQLGNGNKNSVSIPTAVIGLQFGVLRVEAGERHTCAHMISGDVLCWGLNDNGQLGDGSRSSKTSPIKVLEDVQLLSVGGSSSCALVGKPMVLYCWGKLVSTLSPASVNLAENIVDISVGGDHLCGLGKTFTKGPKGELMVVNASLRCLGYNTNGELGDGNVVTDLSKTNVSGPVDVLDVKPFRVISMATGYQHTCVVEKSEDINRMRQNIQCWGRDNEGQIGNGPGASKPGAISSPTTIFLNTASPTSVHLGEKHSCRLSSVGAVQCWGDNSVGQLGDGTNQSSDIPASFVDGISSGVINVGVGRAHVCVVLGEGSIKCWGSNEFGQLGNGTTNNSNSPTLLSQ